MVILKSEDLPFFMELHKATVDGWCNKAASP